MPEFFDPRPERQHLVLVDPPTIRKAQQIPLDAVLDGITGNDPEVTDYILAEVARCPRCRRAITEKTLVDGLVKVRPAGSLR